MHASLTMYHALPTAAGSLPYLCVTSGPSYAPIEGEARIKVIGVGGGGGNALVRMITADMQVSKFWEEAPILYLCP